MMKPRKYKIVAKPDESSGRGKFYWWVYRKDLFFWKNLYKLAGTPNCSAEQAIQSFKNEFGGVEFANLKQREVVFEL